MRREDFAILGQILKPQGNKGELRVALEFTLTEYLIQFAKEHKILYTENKSSGEILPFKIENFWLHNKGFGIFKFFEINSISEAEQLCGKNLLILEKERWSLPENSYYHDEIIGLEVIDIANRKLLGKIKDVISSAGNDLYVVNDGENVFYLPAVKEMIKKIDLQKKLMEVQIPKGLTDLNKTEKSNKYAD